MYYFFNFSAFDTQIEFGLEAKNLMEARKVLKYLKKSAEEFERQHSRFKKNSELSKFNNSTKNPRFISAEMKEMIVLAKKWHKKTKGIFDPTIIGQLKMVGYDKTFSLTRKYTVSKKIATKNFSALGFKNVKITDSKIFTPENWQIDLGGIGKSFWVDKMAKWIKKYTNNFFLSAGGDIYLSGKMENNQPWEVGVEDPKQTDADLLNLTNKKTHWAVATSGINRRSGEVDGRAWHHLIDPHTGAPAENDILTVTVVSENIITADLLAKTILIIGKKDGLKFVGSQTGNECVIIEKNLQMIFSKNFKQYIL